MDNKLVVYEGFFFKNLGGMLKSVVEHQHMTTQFMPTFYHTIMYGKKAKFKVVGYANDGKNEGLKIVMIEGDEKMRALYGLAPNPHITLSVSEEGKPIDTGDLNFYEIENGPVLEGVFGGFCGTTLRPLLYPFRYSYID